MANIHVSRSGTTLGVFEEEKVREGLRTGEYIGTDLGWMDGMAAWRPLSELDDFRAAPPPPPVEPMPSETAAVTEGAGLPAVVAPTARPGLPWERREELGWFNALLETIQVVLLRPTEAFSIMRREGGFFDPLLYTLILGMLGGVVSFGFSFALSAIGMGRENGMGALFGVGMLSLGWLVAMPFVIVVFTFLAAGLFHLVLMLLGGANQSFETTLRVLCYGSGSANVLQLIPLCGGLIALIYSLVLHCIGLTRAHETESWKAVVAVLSPFLLCCGGSFLFVLMMGGLAALGGNWH